MKKLFVSIVIFFVSCGMCYGAEGGTLLPKPSDNPQVCFTQETAREMVTALQRCRIQSEEIIVIEEANQQLQVQVDALTQRNITVTDNFNTCVAASAKKDVLMKQKDAACDERVDKAKPSLWTMISSALGVFAIGLIIGLVI